MADARGRLEVRTWLLLSVVFFLSGGSALVLETLWFRQAGLALGNSVWASGVVLASFMSGLALGNGLAARAAAWTHRPLRAYAALEGVVAVLGAGLVWGWPLLAPALGALLGDLRAAPLALNATRLGVAFLLMMLPASAMGATLPVLTRAVRPAAESFGQALGWLYGVNTLGATAGAVAAEVWLVPSLGVRGSALFAAGLNLAAAATALTLARGREAEALDATAAARPGVARRVMAAAFLCGFAMLALEVVWFRFLSLFIASSSLAFALLLAVVLLGIGLGGLAAAAWLRTQPAAVEYLNALLLLAGVLALTGYASFDRLGGLEQHSGSWPRILGLAAYLTLPVSLLSGMAFALLGQRAHPQGAREMRTAGQITLANTLGAMAGSVLGAFLLLPALGVERSLLAVAASYLVAAAVLPAPRGSSAARISAAAALALWAVVIAFFPHGMMQRRYLAAVARRFAADGSRPIGAREGLTETLVYMRRDEWSSPPVFRLVTNGFSMSSTSLMARRYMSLYAWWPAAVHERVRRALLISYGCGTTARALTLVPGIEQIDVVDISRDILEASRLIHSGDDPLEDPRVRVHVEDGRHFLLTTRQHYDLVTGEPPPPRAAGVVSLYTREYFRLMRTRLAPGGLATYWLPVDQLLPQDTRAVVAGFCDAFPDCSLWRGVAYNWMLVGTAGLGRVTEPTFVRPWNDAVLGAALAGIGVERPEQMGALFIADAGTLAAWVADAPPVTDDFPYRILHRLGSLDLRNDILPVYDDWARADACRSRFATSLFVQAVWPEDLRRRSLSYFEWEGRYADALVRNTFWDPPSIEGLPELDAVLTRSPLRTLALWHLGSHVDEQRYALERAGSGQRLEEILGLGALAERAYERAAESFARAGGSANRCRQAYALALSGRGAEVERIARQALAGQLESEAEFWSWMNRRFGYPSASPAAPAGVRARPSAGR